MHVNIVGSDELSPTLSQIAGGLSSRVPADLAPAFDHFMRLLGNSPEHAERLFPYYLGIWQGNSLGDRTTELVRLAVANGTRCPICLTTRYVPDAVNENDVRAIDDDAHQRLSPGERAAVRFATDFAGDHHAIGGEQFEELRRHYSDAQITELLLVTALFLGIGRLMKVTDLVSVACPVNRAPV